MSGVRAEARVKGTQLVVGEGKVGYGGDADGGSGCGTDEGWEETDGKETETD